MPRKKLATNEAVRISGIIKAKMEEKNMTPSELANAIHVQNSTVSRYISSDPKKIQTPELDKITAICDVLDMSLDDLLKHKVKKEYSFKYSTNDIFYNLFMLYSEGIITRQANGYGNSDIYAMSYQYDSLYQDFFNDLDKINELGVKDDEKIRLYLSTIQNYKEKLDFNLSKENDNGNKTDIDYELPF
jgi:transcriptional regulator with XRE-family HTH domain